MKSQPIQNLPDGWFLQFHNVFLMIFNVGRIDDVMMKTVKMLVLQKEFNHFA